jgi:hypothetical protein
MCYVPQDTWSTPRAPLMSLANVTWTPTKNLHGGLVRFNKKVGAEIVLIRALVLPAKILEPKPTKGPVRVRTITKSSGKAISEKRRAKKAALAINFFFTMASRF